MITAKEAREQTENQKHRYEFMIAGIEDKINESIIKMEITAHFDYDNIKVNPDTLIKISNQLISLGYTCNITDSEIVVSW